MNFKYVLVVAVALATALRPIPACAQDLDTKLKEYRRAISDGKPVKVTMETGRHAPGASGEELRWSGPGMVYVEGLIAPDGAGAIRLFRLVADSLGAGPKREDALARMYQEYKSGRRNDYTVMAAPGSDERGASWLTTGYDPMGALRPDTAGPADTAGRIMAVYAIQVGAFSVAENAEKLSNLLASKGLRPVIYDNLIDGKRLLHLVWVGRYDNREEAKPELERIERLTGLRGVLREQMIWMRY